MHRSPRQSGAGAGFEASKDIREDSKELITDTDLRKVQATIVQVIAGFAPPEEPVTRKGLGIDEVAIELGFQLEAAPGKIWRITLVDAKATASISATVTWRRNRAAPQNQNTLQNQNAPTE